MINDTVLFLNERSAGGELISEANLLFKQNTWKMKKAVGELSLKTKNAKDSRHQTLFPDLIIFEDENNLKPLVGWELKMPDVSIDDDEFVSNARDKADRLGTSVFVLWNFQYVSVYIRNNDKSWNNYPTVIFDKYKEILNSRLSVQSNPSVWKKQLYEILSYLNQCLIEEKFKGVSIEFNISSYVQTITNKLTPITADFIVKSGNHRLLNYIKQWVKTEKAELESIHSINTIEKYAESYAKNIIIKWINRLIFAHLLRENNNSVNKILVKFSENEDIFEFRDLLNSVVTTTDFYTILHVDDYEVILPKDVISNLNEFNLYLGNCDFSEVGITFTSKILESIVDTAKRELMGLYTTPKGLARYLVEITLEDSEGHFADFTAGSGTIAKFLMEKISEYKGIEYAHNHIWVSDKYSYALQAANLAITSRESMNFKNIVFQCDAIDISLGQEIYIVNPLTGETERLSIPKFNCIISNLPFISSNNRLGENQNLIRLVEENNIDNRADLYQILILKYKELLADSDKSKIGVIISNSWFKTQKGYKSFYKTLIDIFDIEFVITSNKGKWFDNADVVASIVVLKNKKVNYCNKVKFIGLNKNPSSCSKIELDELISNTILGRKTSEMSVQEYNNEEVLGFINIGMSLEALFDDVSWLREVLDKLICLNKIFNSSRGVRTGADKLFIMEDIKVDNEYSYPILKNLNHIDKYIIEEVNNYYFYTKNSIEDMRELGFEKTIGYLKSIENHPSAIIRKNKIKDSWFKADQVPQYADFTTSINPERRFFWSKFENPTVVNQRVTAFRIKEQFKNDVDLIHALLNSSISLFLLMSSGFGRGLGVTDLTKDGISQSYFLNPNLLELKAKNKIIKCWNKVKNKNIEDILEQLNDQEWIKFNKIVLLEFGLQENVYDSVKSSIINLLKRRLSVKK